MFSGDQLALLFDFIFGDIGYPTFFILMIYQIYFMLCLHEFV